MMSLFNHLVQEEILQVVHLYVLFIDGHEDFIFDVADLYCLKLFLR